MTDKRAFEALLDDLLGASFDQDWPAEKKARAAVLAAYEEAAGREGEPVSSIDYWQKRGHHVCPECNGTRVRSYRQADHLGGQYVDVPCECAHPAPKADESKMVAACCGRSECGGECGNEWRGMEPEPKADAAADWVCVPREPTEAMLIGARDWGYDTLGKPVGNPAAIGIYKAMIAAASPARGGDVKPEEEWRYIACSERSALDKNTFVDGFVRAAYYLGLVNEAAMSREAQ